MKKSILFTVLLSLLAVIAYAQKPKAPEREGWGDSPLYGNVESVTITNYVLAEKFGEIVKDMIDYKEVYKFNQKGDVIEKADYKSDGSLSGKWLYKYDSQGKLIERAICNSYGSLGSK